MCMLSNDIYDYVNVSQGKITIPGMDDGEEFVLTDVSLIPEYYIITCLKFTHLNVNGNLNTGSYRNSAKFPYFHRIKSEQIYYYVFRYFRIAFSALLVLT